MRINRDTVILFVTLAPIVAVGYAYIHWRQTGIWPGWVPQFDIPQMQAPNWMSGWRPPPAVQSRLGAIESNWMMIVVGVGGGTLVGILSVGTVADTIRGIHRALFKSTGRREDDYVEDEVEESVAEPIANLTV